MLKYVKVILINIYPKILVLRSIEWNFLIGGINFYIFFRVRIIIYRTDFVNILLKIIYYKNIEKNNKQFSNSFLNFS